LYLLLEGNGGEGFKAFVEFGKRLVLSAFACVGWDAKPSDSHTDNLLRATLIGLLDTFAYNDPEILSECRRRFDGHWEDASLLPSEYKSTVYKIVLKNGGVAEYEAILKTFYATEDNAEKRFAFSLGAASSVQICHFSCFCSQPYVISFFLRVFPAQDALKIRTLDWAIKSSAVKTQDFFYPVGVVASSARGSEITWKYFKEVRCSVIHKFVLHR
jgi:puromycin-sensitive aminopeptidase